MNYLLLILVVLNSIFSAVICNECKDDCPKEGKMICALSPENKNYTLFPTECAMKAYSICHNVQFVETPLKFCINNQLKNARRSYGESCPLFCPSHYRPVCGMSKIRAYIYKSFNNGCYFDMLACRGDELEEYVEVPLEFCQRHLMKNIFKTQVVVSGLNDFRDYHEY